MGGAGKMEPDSSSRCAMAQEADKLQQGKFQLNIKISFFNGRDQLLEQCAQSS